MVKQTVTVCGMMCGNCEKHMADAVRNNFPVTDVTADRTKNRVVFLAEAPVDEAKLKSVVEDTGYEFGGVTTEVA